ncbi:MFS transporter [Labrys miyagiensis]|uniref:MFS transporter n=1 Tax=Labrys miyagiensis TaxID=346912 RepID=A0ABQ6CQ09_9HYPH|nr:MFS transporter [Labrys miyagiensis]GLS20307.1 MFS transporter [Labrys miyagiensis]
MIPGNKFLSILKSIASDRRLAFMLALGFSSGLPYLLIVSTQSARLRESGISLTDIGLFYYASSPYSLKFLWASFIDRLDPPFLRRFCERWRGWMLLAQLGVAIGLLGLAFSDPAKMFWATAASAIFTAFCSASQDIVIDGWRINIVPKEEQGVMLAVALLGYRLGVLCAGAGALYIADFANWRIAYLCMMLMMLIGIVAALFTPAPQRIETHSDDVAIVGTLTEKQPSAKGLPPKNSWLESFLEPLGDLFQRWKWMLIPILLLVAIYRLPDFISGTMNTPLYIDLGFSKSEIASVTKVFSFWITIVAPFFAGLSIWRLGLMPSLLIGGIAAASSHLSLALLAAHGADISLLTLAVSVESLAASFAGIALAAYMSSLTSPRYAASQYALLSSLYALPGHGLAGISGAIVDTIGYPAFFISTSTIGIPVAALCVFIWLAAARQSNALPRGAEARRGES